MYKRQQRSSVINNQSFTEIYQCSNNCDNVTGACRPLEYEEDFYFFLAMFVFQIGKLYYLGLVYAIFFANLSVIDSYKIATKKREELK